MNRKQIVNTYYGHVVRLHDQDSGDEFNVEVLINDKVADEVAAAEGAALKHELATLSGNTFKADYMEPSGRVIRVTKITEELKKRSMAAEEMLEDHRMG